MNKTDYIRIEEQVGGRVNRTIANPSNVPISINPPFSTSSNVQEQMPLKSLKGRRCLTKCYPKGTSWLHPILMTPIISHYDACATDYSYKKRDSKTQVGEDWFDPCLLVDNYKYNEPDELVNTLLQFYFDPNDLLSTIYDILSFDDVIYWTLENNHLPIDTIIRVHNCAWKAYGSDSSNITNVVVDYYYDIASNNWLHQFVDKIRENYSFDMIKEIDTSSNNSTNESESTNLIYDFLLNNYFTAEFFSQEIRQFSEDYKKTMEDLESPYTTLKKYVFDSLLRLITKTKN